MTENTTLGRYRRRSPDYRLLEKVTYPHSLLVLVYIAMNKQNYRSTSTSKHALITPSPTPFSHSSSSDGLSPTKRPRLTSISTATSSPSVATPPAFSAQTFFTDTNLHDSRRASSSRVLNVWSQLAERYSRPLAEDDIVDLRTGDIIRDRNVLRSTPGKYDFGCFGYLDADGEDGTRTPTEEGEEEGSDDELDAFAPGADISDELELARVEKSREKEVEMDPADAEDLRDFLEEEKRRREALGSEGEGGEGESVEEDRDLEGEVELSGTDWSADEVEDGLEDNLPADSEQDSEVELEPGLNEKDDLSSQGGDFTEALHTDEDSGSDDELAIWDHGEGSMVYVIAGDLDVDVIELPLPEPAPPFPSSPVKRGRPRKGVRVHNQNTDLMTPPLRQPSKSKSKLKFKKSTTPVQLHTPPRSSLSTTAPDIVASVLPLPPPVGISTPPPSLRKKAKSNLQSKVTSTARSTCKSSSKSNWSVPPSGSDGESDDPIMLVSSPSQPLKRIALRDADTFSAYGSESDVFSTPLSSRKKPPASTITPSRGRVKKRKRVPSSSLEADPDRDKDHSNEEAGTAPRPILPVVSPDIGIIDFRRERYECYEREQTSPVPKIRSRGKHKKATRSDRSVNQIVDFGAYINDPLQSVWLTLHFVTA